MNKITECNIMNIMVWPVQTRKQKYTTCILKEQEICLESCSNNSFGKSKQIDDTRFNYCSLPITLNENVMTIFLFF